MSDVDMTELRRLAEGATAGPKGPWRVEGDPGLECSECGAHDGEHWIVRKSDGAGVAVVLVDDRDEAIARYISAASPSVVLALLDRVERAERKAETHERDWYEAKSEFGTAMAKMREALRAAERRELEARAALIRAEEDHRAAVEALDVYESRIREIADHVLGIQPPDVATVVLLDAIEREAGQRRIAQLQAEAEVARLRDALDAIEGGHPCDEEHREMARAALDNARKP